MSKNNILSKYIQNLKYIKNNFIIKCNVIKKKKKNGEKITILDILNELTGEDLSDQMDENIFENGLLDSMATVQMLLELQDKCGVTAPVSEFHREDWDTPNKIIAKVESLRNE